MSAARAKDAFTKAEREATDPVVKKLAAGLLELAKAIDDMERELRTVRDQVQSIKSRV